MQLLVTHVTIIKQNKKKQGETWFFHLIPGFSFKVGSEVRQQNLDRWDSIEKPVFYR